MCENICVCVYVDRESVILVMNNFQEEAGAQACNDMNSLDVCALKQTLCMNASDNKPIKV